MQAKGALWVLLAAVALGTAGTNADARTSAAEAASGTLNLRAELQLVSRLDACPPGVAANTCATRTAEGVVPGLGSLAARYTWIADVGPPSCAEAFGITRAYGVELAVAGKGDIHLAVAGAGQCVDQEAVRTQPQAFTVTGGTGIYAGSSGGGTVERKLGAATDVGRRGTETWTGTLSVPGREFDTTPPVLSGAVAKRARVPRGVTRARVTYKVTARDDVDGSITATCRPPSGSRFKIGRTVVTCLATDLSGNTATASFPVIVRRR